MTKKRLFAFLSILSSSTFAAEQHTLSEHFPIANSQTLEIDIPVGKLEVATYNGDKVEVLVKLKAQDNDHWYNLPVDLNALKLYSRRHDHTLSLAIDEENVKQNWLVKVPTSMQLDLEVDVGNVKVNELANSANIEVGVGKVSINTTQSDFKKVELETGVGNTSLVGFDHKVEHYKKVTNSQTNYHGEGKYKLSVEVGVGNIKVHH